MTMLDPRHNFKHQITVTTTASTDHVLRGNGMLEKKAKTKGNKEGHSVILVSVCRHSHTTTATWDSTQEDMRHKKD